MKVAVAPSAAVLAVGWVVMEGLDAAAVTVSFTSPEYTVPTLLETLQR